MNNNIKDIILKRLQILTIDETKNRKSKNDKILAKTIQLELFNLGYNLKDWRLITNKSGINYDNVISVLEEYKGGDVTYVPMFSNFPNEVPGPDFFAKRITVFFSDILGLNTDQNIRDSLFDMDNFGADPVYGRQIKELYDNGKEKQENSKDVVKSIDLTDIQVMTNEDSLDKLINWTIGLLYSPTSIPEYLTRDLHTILSEYGNIIIKKLDLSKIKSKEVKSFLLVFAWNNDVTLDGSIGNTLFLELQPNFTDLLRLSAGLTDSDISLQKNIVLPKFKRKERKFLVSYMSYLLNNKGISYYIDDIAKYNDLWKTFFKHIHISEYINKDIVNMKLLEELVQSVRNDSIITTNSIIEKALNTKDINTVIDMVRKQPGIFTRRLVELLGTFNSLIESKAILSNYKDIIDKVPAKNLFILEKYLNVVKDQNTRLFRLKNGKTFIKPVSQDEKIRKISDDSIETLKRLINNNLIKRYSNRSKYSFIDENIKKITIDPALKKYIFPFSSRSLTEGTLKLERGTRIDVSDKVKDRGVLRLYTYWVGAIVDLDLSIYLLDENLSVITQVSYTELKDPYNTMKHSGDIQRAPKGAAEFIDIDIEKVKEKYPNAKHITMQVYAYNNINFESLDKAYAGFSFRDTSEAMGEYRTFDIKNVEAKFNITNQGKVYLGVMYDLYQEEVIIIDQFINSQLNMTNSNENSFDKIIVNLDKIINSQKSTPNIYDTISIMLAGYIPELLNSDDVEEDEVFKIGISKDDDINPENIDEKIGELLL